MPLRKAYGFPIFEGFKGPCENGYASRPLGKLRVMERALTEIVPNSSIDAWTRGQVVWVMSCYPTVLDMLICYVIQPKPTVIWWWWPVSNLSSL
ncbi:hypothetical protein TNIN_308021 [Trichonephila inaurata madagascariensis]|uniref:Uncharacterized protein n=1 Tax=Trichonephila inaurata madagascariensis TaxID=2747483 RepID=A0A8X6YTL9_9ARAC|nr:hypothetical protein TNIN_308021 [Trichonephila inaurata madagascariensis]